MKNQIIKAILILTALFVVIKTYNNSNSYFVTKNKNETIIRDETKRVADAEQDLKNLKIKLQKKEEMIEKSNQALETQKQALENIIAEINKTNSFKAKLLTFSRTQSFINAISAQIEVNVALKHFGINTFQDILIEEFSKVGQVYEFKSEDGKKCTIKIAILDKKESR